MSFLLFCLHVFVYLFFVCLRDFLFVSLLFYLLICVFVRLLVCVCINFSVLLFYSLVSIFLSSRAVCLFFWFVSTFAYLSGFLFVSLGQNFVTLN